MVLLAALIIAFGVVHIAPGVPAVKASLRAVLGRAYGPVYGVASLLLLVLALWALRTSDRPDAYFPPNWGRHANFLLSLIGFVFLGIFIFRGSWRNVIGYPMTLAVVFWSSGHLLANGDWGSVVFFGGLLLAAVIQAALLMQTGGPVAIETRQGHNLLSVLGGIALYGIVVQLHGVIAGVPVISLQP
jgi:uncharacterized membrane protein